MLDLACVLGDRCQEALSAERVELGGGEARFGVAQRQRRLDLNCHHLVQHLLHQLPRRHFEPERRHEAGGGPVGGGREQHAALGAVDARPHAEEHVDDEVVRERVLRVGRHAAPLVARVDPQPDLLLVAPGHALPDQVALEVAAQLPRGHRRGAVPEHRLHKVLRAGRGGRRAAHEVGVGLVRDHLVAEDVLVHASEERRRRVLGRTVLLELVRDDDPRVALVGVVLVRRHVRFVLASDGVLDRSHVGLRARVHVDHHHILEENLQVVHILGLVQLEEQRHQPVLQRLRLGGEVVSVVHGRPALETRRARRLGAHNDARDHALRQVDAPLVRVAVGAEVISHHCHVDVHARVAPVLVLEVQVKPDLEGRARHVRVKGDVYLAEVVIWDRHLRAHSSIIQILHWASSTIDGVVIRVESYLVAVWPLYVRHTFQSRFGKDGWATFLAHQREENGIDLFRVQYKTRVVLTDTI
mmetsp:Transcript_43769/g.103499  ORF Transcript_43769/g.103499 Transcript_43769/m.103499 type:complete len:470 (+) Transcript_43769:843-2252(+)